MQPASSSRRLAWLVIVAAASISLSAQTTPLRLVSTPWPPFTNETDPRFALDLVEAALGRINLKATTTIVEPARFTPSLLSNAFDGSAAAWKDPERESALIFSQPYLENRLILVGRRDEDVSAASITALKGKRIAIVEGYAYGEGITASGATLVPARSEEDSLAQLLNNTADYVLMDDLVVQFIVDHYPDQAKTRLNVGSKPLLTRPLYFALRKNYPNAATIISRFNAQLRGMIADRTYHRLLHVAWIRADVDGDGIPEYIPQSDKSGSAQPEHAYSLFASSSAAEGQKRFYYGGTIYTDWATVPNRYKVEDPRYPDPARSTASIFRFVW
jgi:polar amino acid transport system substrate-binding protein